MVKLFLDGQPVEVAEGTTLLRAAQEAGRSIPHFCYHPAFAPEGSCRMCLVEIEGLPKLELACSTVVREGMEVWTTSDKVIEARRGVLEFLLAEHPLDCPICDKAGDCKLQDYYQDYGLSEPVFQEDKERRAKKVRLGKSLLLDRERCILCTRCVRFLAEVTQTHELGVFERGIHSEIGTYEDLLVGHNYSGCLAEICPVGAITDTDFRFKTRNWFLAQGDTICPLCSRGCSITIEHHPGFPRRPGSRRVYRVKARLNPAVNGHWICDRGRYGYGQLDEGRQECLAVNSADKIKGSTWPAVASWLAERMKSGASRTAVIASACLSNEELFLVHKLFRQGLKVRKLFLVDHKPGEADGRLLTADRSPNRRGATELGFALQAPGISDMMRESSTVVLFGPSILEHHSLEAVRGGLAGVSCSVLFTSRQTELAGLVDVAVPAAPWAEKEGSFTNIDGRVQSFRPVRPPLGESLAVWKALVDLGRRIFPGDPLYAAGASPASLRAALAAEFSFFAKTHE